MAHKELLLSWLNDAYGMEKNIIQVLQNHVKDAKDHPAMQQKLQEHLDVTRHQAEMLKDRIEALGGSVSTVKSTTGTVMGAITGVTTGAAEDELVKNMLSDYATEHFEIASYRALIKGAQDLGDDETVRLCQQLLREEEDMARFLEQNLPTAVHDVLSRKAAEHREAGRS
jgi:ferritin-like metal-binding protein YciE